MAKSGNTVKALATITPFTNTLIYLRPDQAIEVLPISRRCLSNWQRRGVIPFYRIGRTVMFKRQDIEVALERFRVAAVGEPRPRKITPTAPAPTPARKRRMERVK